MAKAKRSTKAKPKKPAAPEHQPPLDIVKREAFQDGVRTVMRVVRDPLDRLIAYGHVTKRQFMAGDKLRADYTLGVEGARDPEARGGGGFNIGPGEAQLMALTEYKKAVRRLGLIRAAVVVPVVCGGVDIASLARRLKMDPKKLAGLFGAALDDLADHYRYARDGAAERRLAEELLAAYLPKDLSKELLDLRAAAG